MREYLYREVRDVPHERRLRLLGIAVLALWCVGCGGSTEPRDAAIGSYRLVSLNGKALPTVAFSATDSVYSGEAHLLGNGTYTVHLSVKNFLVLSPPISDVNEAGTWSRVGDSIHFVPPAGSEPYSGAYAGGSLSLQLSDTWRFEKQ